MLKRIRSFYSFIVFLSLSIFISLYLYFGDARKNFDCDISALRAEIGLGHSDREKFSLAEKAVDSCANIHEIISVIDKEDSLCEEDQLIAIAIGRRGNKIVIPILSRLFENDSRFSSVAKQTLDYLKNGI